MKFQDAFIAVVIVTIVLVGAFAFIGDLSIKHEANVDWTKAGQLNSTAKRIENLSRGMNNTYSNVNDMELAPEGSSENPFAMIRTGWTTAKLVGSSWFIFADLVKGLVGYLNLPDQMVGILNVLVHGLIFITLIVMLIYAFWKWKVET